MDKEFIEKHKLMVRDVARRTLADGSGDAHEPAGMAIEVSLPDGTVVGRGGNPTEALKAAKDHPSLLYPSVGTLVDAFIAERNTRSDDGPWLQGMIDAAAHYMNGRSGAYVGSIAEHVHGWARDALRTAEKNARSQR